MPQIIYADDRKCAEEIAIQENRICFGEFYRMKLKCLKRPTKDEPGAYLFQWK